MPTLRFYREAEFLPKYQSLPPTVQTKICMIEKLFEMAMLYLKARDSAPAGVPDFDSLLIDIAKNMVNATEKELEEKPQEEGAGNPDLGFQYDYWITIIGDSRYRPLPDLSHLAYMLAALWIYWITWPFSRRRFEGRKEISLIDWRSTPPSAPSFEANLDRSLVRLAQKVGTETANILHWGKKKEGIARQNIERKAKSMIREVEIIDAFHAIPKNKGDSRNRIVTRIYNYLKRSIGKKTIERYIKNNVTLMERCFQEEGDGKRRRIIYIGHTHE